MNKIKNIFYRFITFLLFMVIPFGLLFLRLSTYEKYTHYTFSFKVLIGRFLEQVALNMQVLSPVEIEKERTINVVVIVFIIIAITLYQLKFKGMMKDHKMKAIVEIATKQKKWDLLLYINEWINLVIYMIILSWASAILGGITLISVTLSLVFGSALKFYLDMVKFGVINNDK